MREDCSKSILSQFCSIRASLDAGVLHLIFEERFWHAQIVFAQAAKGPVIIGDGRFLGLGIMAPKLTF